MDTRLVVLVEAEVMERIRRLAEEDQVSVGEVVRRALTMMLGNEASAKSQEVANVPRP